VGLRTLEAGIIAVGVVPMLVIVTLRQQLRGTAGTDPATLVTIGSALVGFYNWTFLVGPGLVCRANTMLMAYLMWGCPSTRHVVCNVTLGVSFATMFGDKEAA
jgi:hypothetical protein